jgi:putative phage-type endonuclease
MQTNNELLGLLVKERPDASAIEINEWINVLLQLKGCHVHSFAAQGIDDEGWHAARAKGIGGSEIAAILGKSTWSSPTDIYLKKIPQFEQPAQEPQSEAARWGNVLEDTIIREWSTRTGRKYIHLPVSLQSDDNPIFIANVDGFELDENGKVVGILECKTTSLYNENCWREGEIPIYYVYQIQWYMMITGLKTACIMCLVGGQHLYYYDLPAVDAIAEEEKAGAVDFWENHVIPCVAPELTDVDADRLQKAKAEEVEHGEPIITDDEETIQILENYVAIREQISALEKLKKVTYAQMLEKLGTANELIAGDRQVKCSTSNRRTCDFELLQNKYPMIYEEVVSMASSVRITVK